jgi:hypothetical protein
MSELSFEQYKIEVSDMGSDELAGVYEAWWLANSLYPGRLLSERLAIAERAIRELLGEGLIKLYVGTVKVATSEPPVAPEATGKLLKDWATWTIPDGPTVFYLTTELGERAFYARYQEDV